jgi:hypothetical protein
MERSGLDCHFTQWPVVNCSMIPVQVWYGIRTTIHRRIRRLFCLIATGGYIHHYWSSRHESTTNSTSWTGRWHGRWRILIWAASLTWKQTTHGIRQFNLYLSPYTAVLPKGSKDQRRYQNEPRLQGYPPLSVCSWWFYHNLARLARWCTKVHAQIRNKKSLKDARNIIGLVMRRYLSICLVFVIAPK